MSQANPDSPKNMFFFLKNPQFLPNHYETLSKWGPHVYIFFAPHLNSHQILTHPERESDNLLKFFGTVFPQSLKEKKKQDCQFLVFLLDSKLKYWLFLGGGQGQGGGGGGANVGNAQHHGRGNHHGGAAGHDGHGFKDMVY